MSFLGGSPASLFVRDLFGQTTEALPVGTGIGQPDISADGRFVAFTRDEEAVRQVFRYDRKTGVAVPEMLVSNGGESVDGDGASGAPAVSGTGQFVAFPSLAGNLIAAGLDTAGPDMDVFVNDLGPTANSVPVAGVAALAATEDILLDDAPLTYTDADGNDVAIEIVSQPAHAITFELSPPGPGSPAATVDYQAGQDYSGEDSFSYRVGDAHGWSDPQVVTITIENVNDAPAWDSVPTLAGPVAEGDETRLDLRPFVGDPDADDTFTFEIVDVSESGGRAGVGWIAIENDYEIVISPPYDVATFTETPVSFDVTLQVTDGNVATPVELGQPMVVQVANTDRPPTVDVLAIDPTTPATLDDLVADITASDPDDGDDGVLSLEFEWLWNGQHLPAFDGLDTLPHAETFKGEEWAVRVRATARGLQSDWAASSSVTVTNTAPVAETGEAAGNENDDIAIDLVTLVTDPDAAEGVDTLSFSIIAPAPPLGTYDLTGSVLTYSPGWDALAAGAEESVTLHFRVTDGDAPREDTVNFTIGGTNDAPSVAVVSHLRLRESDTEGSIVTGWAALTRNGSSGFGGAAITVSDVDSAEENVSFRIKSLPSSGTLLDGGVPASVGDDVAIGATLTYEPDPGAEGTDTFTVAGWDGNDETPIPAEVKIFLGRFTATVHLVNGWNTIALPLIPDNPVIAELLSAGRAQLYVDAPLGFNGRHWAPVTEATVGEGFVVFCEELPPAGVDIAVPGTAAESCVAVNTGWHLRGGIGHQGEVDYVPERVEGGDYGRGWMYETDEAGRISVPTGMTHGKAGWYRVATPGDVDFSLNKP